MSEKEKLELLVKNHFETDVKERYITNKENIYNEEIVKIIKVKMDTLDVNIVELLAEGITSITPKILFKAGCKRDYGLQKKIFVFSCKTEVEYKQTEQKYIIASTENYEPIEDKDALSYFEIIP